MSDVPLLATPTELATSCRTLRPSPMEMMFVCWEIEPETAPPVIELTVTRETESIFYSLCGGEAEGRGGGGGGLRGKTDGGGGGGGGAVGGVV